MTPDRLDAAFAALADPTRRAVGGPDALDGPRRDAAAASDNAAVEYFGTDNKAVSLLVVSELDQLA